MTREQALIEAKRRWGTSAFTYKSTLLQHFDVGDSKGVRGHGSSWKAALSDAMMREQMKEKAE